MGTVEYRGSSGLIIVADEQGPEQGPVVLLLHGGGQNRLAWKGSGAGRAGEMSGAPLEAQEPLSRLKGPWRPCVALPD